MIPFLFFQSLFNSFTSTGDNRAAARVSVTWEAKRNVVCQVKTNAMHPRGGELPTAREDNEDMAELEGKQTRYFRLPATKGATLTVEVECRERGLRPRYEVREKTWEVR